MKNILIFPGVDIGARQQDSEPSIDHAHVMQMKALIAEGKLEINSGNVADKLLVSLREILSTDERKPKTD